MVLSEVASPLTMQSQRVPSPETREDIIDLILASTPYNKWIYAGEISRSIKERVGTYVSPDRVGRLVYKGIRTIKRVWTPQGWKYRRVKTLEDY